MNIWRDIEVPYRDFVNGFKRIRVSVPVCFAALLRKVVNHGIEELEADKFQGSIRSQQGSEGRTHERRLEDCGGECPVPEGQGEEVRGRKQEEPLDGEERFYWGGKGNTQPYTETYNVLTGTWHRDL